MAEKKSRYAYVVYSADAADTIIYVASSAIKAAAFVRGRNHLVTSKDLGSLREKGIPVIRNDMFHGKIVIRRFIIN